ncbi:O-antigen ligase family protein [Aeoliella sp.]|uniref:O-antigen ligase family protein n=1 Tax=Aeoliella sp. TaxID=2795800 RepID=UPI003CCB8D14
MYEIELPFIPDYSKMSATCFGVFAGTLFFDPVRLRNLKFHWYDVPVVVYCLAPLPSSLTNGLGLYDGVSGVVGHAIGTGMPYLVGRLYFRTAEDLRELAWAIFVAGVVYIPFCLFEMRMSPYLHYKVYGFHPGTHTNLWRFGGYRPVVFMRDGLQLSVWMMVASLTGCWLWWHGQLRRIAHLAPGLALTALLVTTFLTRSMGALLLFVVGLAVLVAAKVTGSRLPIIALILVPPAFVAIRTTGAVDWQVAVDVARLIEEDRAMSLRGRFVNEDLLMEKALQRPIFGWGGWGRNRVYDEYDEDQTITDGLWIIELGKRGFVGLVAIFAVLLMPLARLVANYPARRLLSGDLAAPLVLGICVVLYAIDCLPNCMPTPVYLVAAGAVTGMVPWAKSNEATGVEESSSRNSTMNDGARVLPRQIGRRS